MSGLSIQSSSGLRTTTGTYEGNSTSNRGIPHELTVFKFAHIITSAGDSSSFKHFTAQGIQITSPDIAPASVNLPDSTNFYVGDSVSGIFRANRTGRTYIWIAVGTWVKVVKIKNHLSVIGSFQNKQ